MVQGSAEIIKRCSRWQVLPDKRCWLVGGERHSATHLAHVRSLISPLTLADILQDRQQKKHWIKAQVILKSKNLSNFTSKIPIKYEMYSLETYNTSHSWQGNHFFRDHFADTHWAHWEPHYECLHQWHKVKSVVHERPETDWVPISDLMVWWRC